MKNATKSGSKGGMRRSPRMVAPGSSVSTPRKIPGFQQEQSPFDWGSDDGDHGESLRRRMVRREAASAGLTGGDKTARIAGRVTPALLAAAREKSGIASDTELLEYALSKVALEDDFGEKLLRLKGSIPKDVEF